jgi:hypothetical protein
MRQVLFISFIVFITLLTRPVFSESTSIYYNGEVVSLEQPKVIIGHVYGVKLSPINSKITSKNADYIYIPHTIENLSNITNRFDVELKVTSPSNGWDAFMVSDDNGDGIHQDNENKIITGPIELSESSHINVFVVLKRTSGTVSDTVSSLIRVSCQTKGGNPYIGYNGVLYGGSAMEDSNDIVTLE